LFRQSAHCAAGFFQSRSRDRTDASSYQIGPSESSTLEIPPECNLLPLYGNRWHSPIDNVNLNLDVFYGRQRVLKAYFSPARPGGGFRPANLPRPRIFVFAKLPYCFIIRRMSEYCFSTWFTSWTEVPLPRAMRLRRLPSISRSSARSAAVIELIIASTEVRRFSSISVFFGRFANGPTLGSMPINCSSEPIFLTWRS